MIQNTLLKEEKTLILVAVTHSEVVVKMKELMIKQLKLLMLLMHFNIKRLHLAKLNSLHTSKLI